MKIHYYREKLLKMGRWSLLPADSENWHGEHTARYFRKVFGFGKGTLVIHKLNDALPQNCYFPKSYFDRLYDYIAEVNKKDYKSLARKLKSFYPLKQRAKTQIQKLVARNYKIISNERLIGLYRKNRDWAHRATVYDQFGWTAEEYWPPLMEKILTKKYGVKKDSPVYHQVLFALTKPEEISTTLEEKRDVLNEAIKIKEAKQNLAKASEKLSRIYGWMPVFTFGEPWRAHHYEGELKALLKKSLETLKEEYQRLKNYKQEQRQDFKKVVKQYKIEPKDLQVFVDFGLALDARNEAEYIVSFAGFYLLPIYRETARHLVLSVKQVRCLYEDEIVSALRGEIDAEKRLAEKGQTIGWGFDSSMTERINFTEKEAESLFKFIEKRAQNLQGNSELQGVCASPGNAQGKARIVHSPAENAKVQNGDILITHATTVDYLTAMKLAAAIVTEVGGLTCHAAVVSREFGVPCVVGLKNATVNFHDGDLVEVDANKGVVRKL